MGSLQKWAWVALLLVIAFFASPFVLIGRAIAHSGSDCSAWFNQLTSGCFKMQAGTLAPEVDPASHHGDGAAREDVGAIYASLRIAGELVRPLARRLRVRLGSRSAAPAAFWVGPGARVARRDRSVSNGAPSAKTGPPPGGTARSPRAPRHMRLTSFRLMLGYLAFGAATALISACAIQTATPPGPPSAGAAPASRFSRPGSVLPFVLPANVREVCPETGQTGFAYCDSLVRTDVPSGSPSGYGPSGVLQSAYDLPSSTYGNGQSVAIVDAFDDPNAEADLFTYRNKFGLPVCDTLNGCFTKVNQKGKKGTPTRLQTRIGQPRFHSTWIWSRPPVRTAKYSLSKRTPTAGANLGKSVDEAVALGANIVSNNSYGAIGDGAKILPTTITPA